VAEEWLGPGQLAQADDGLAPVRTYMDCSERDRLKEILRIAVHEMAFLYEERVRIAARQPLALARFDEEVIRAAKRHREQAAQDYRNHIEEHGCAARGAADAGVLPED
jgi:hypothetical protein